MRGWVTGWEGMFQKGPRLKGLAGCRLMLSCGRGQAFKGLQEGDAVTRYVHVGEIALMVRGMVVGERCHGVRVRGPLARVEDGADLN